MENPNAIRWIIRVPGDIKSPVERYTAENKRFISIQTVHGGFFKRRGGLQYTGDVTNVFDFIDVGDLCHRFVEKMFIAVGFCGRPYFYYQHPEEDFDYDMIRLQTPTDFARFQLTLWPGKWKATPIIYAESDIPTLHTSYPMTLLDATQEKMVQILCPCICKNPQIQGTGAQSMLLKLYGISFPIPMIEAVLDEAVLAVWGKRKDVCGLGS